MTAGGERRPEVEVVSATVRRLPVEVPAARWEAELDAEYERLRGSTVLPGFPMGGGPRAVIVQLFRHSAEPRVLQELATRAFREAVQQCGLEPVSPPEFTGALPRPGRPLRMVATFQVAPEVKLRKHRGLEVQRAAPPRAPGAAEVEEQLARLCRLVGEARPANRREIRAGDAVLADYEVFVGHEQAPAEKVAEAKLSVEAGDLLDGYLPQAEGARLGEAVEFDYVPDGMAPGQPLDPRLRVVVRLRELRTLSVPPLDASFAQRLGFGSVAELRERVGRNLADAARARADAEERVAILGALVQENPVDPPASMVERALDGLVAATFQAFGRSGAQVLLRASAAAIRHRLRERAAIEARAGLLLDAVAREEHLEPLPDDPGASPDRRRQRAFEWIRSHVHYTERGKQG